MTYTQKDIEKATSAVRIAISMAAYNYISSRTRWSINDRTHVDVECGLDLTSELADLCIGQAMYNAIRDLE